MIGYNNVFNLSETCMTDLVLDSAKDLVEKVRADNPDQPEFIQAVEKFVIQLCLT